MLLISEAQLQALRDRLACPEKRQQCSDELQRMLEIKQALLWRAEEARACCGWCPAARLAGEVQLLESALDALQKGLPDKATSCLDEYILHYGGQQ